MTRLIRLPKRRNPPPAPIRTYRADESLPVASSAIARIEYDPDTRTMIVTMARDGTQITYTDFPEIEAHRMAHASSPGKYFNQFIRGRY